LAEHHGIEKMSEGFQKVSPAECELCKIATAKRSHRGLQIQEGQTTETVNLNKGDRPVTVVNIVNVAPQIDITFNERATFRGKA